MEDYKRIDIPFAAMLNRLRNHQPFAFSRWGDGEWRAVLGKHNGKNCDGHPFFPEMGAELAGVLQSRPSYLLGMQGLAMRTYGKQILAWLRDNQLEDLEWCDADIFHKNAARGNLMPIVNAVQSRDVLLVGPAHLKRLKPKYIDYAGYVEVPDKNVYHHKERIIREIVSVLGKMQKRSAIVAVSASMPAEIILDRLHNPLLSQGHTIVDFGSLWDPLVGVNSRKYHKGLDLP